MADNALPGLDQLDSITDDEILHKMMGKTENFDERKKIRARLREIRDQEAAVMEQRRKERENAREDAVRMRQRQAEAEKQRKLKGYDEMAKQSRNEPKKSQDLIKEKHRQAEEEKQKKLDKYKEMGKTMASAYHAGTDLATRDQIQKSEADKERRMADFQEEAVYRSTKSEQGADGSLTTTTTTTSTEKSKDGRTTVTKQSKQITTVGGLGGTCYSINKQTAGKPDSAKATFKAMDAASPAGRGGGGRVAVQRSPSAIKEMLLNWVKQQVAGYQNVEVTNFSSSWNDGMAFCALIHRFYPNAFDFSRLDPKRRRGNFKLAFDMAEKLADIAPLLEVDDMVKMKNPDWKCVFTYVQSFYRRFRNWDEEQEKAKEKAEA